MSQNRSKELEFQPLVFHVRKEEARFVEKAIRNIGGRRRRGKVLVAAMRAAVKAKRKLKSES